MTLPLPLRFAATLATLLSLAVVSPQAALAQRAGSQPESVKPPIDEKNLSWAILPGIFSTEETGLGFALSSQLNFDVDPLRADPERRSALSLAAAYTLNNQFFTTLRGELFFDGRRHILIGTWQGRLYTNRFYGLGNDAPDLYQIFQERAGRFETDFVTRVFKNLYVGGRHQGEYMGLASVKAPPEREDGFLYLDDPSTPGRKGSHVNGFGPDLLYDYRDHNLYPLSGGFYLMQSTTYPQVFGTYDGGNFSEVAFDLRQFFNPWLEHVIALQLFMEFRIGQAPFNLMGKLGGPYQMRGFFQGRFSDRHYTTAQVEYRMPVVWRFFLVAFASGGTVLGPSSGSFRRGLVWSGGLGIRVLINERARSRLRLDVPVAEEQGIGIPLFQMNEAF